MRRHQSRPSAVHNRMVVVLAVLVGVAVGEQLRAWIGRGQGGIAIGVFAGMVVGLGLVLALIDEDA
jgi:hypothetical protein